jgi:branched-chain amino acid transport system substrate-binding protein
MNMRKLWAVALVAAFVIAACGGGSGGGGASASGSAAVTVNVPDTVHLAAALPLSGADSSIAKIMQDSYVLFFKQLNDAGGLQVGNKKVKFDLKIEDNKGDAAASGQLYEKFITQDNVDLLLGGYNTTITTQEVKVANRYKIPYVGGGGASSSIYVDNV